jgi:hypothetical protein
MLTFVLGKSGRGLRRAQASIRRCRRSQGCSRAGFGWLEVRAELPKAIELCDLTRCKDIEPSSGAGILHSTLLRKRPCFRKLERTYRCAPPPLRLFSRRLRARQFLKLRDRPLFVPLPDTDHGFPNLGRAGYCRGFRLIATPARGSGVSSCQALSSTS